MAMKWPDRGMEMSKDPAILGRMPMITNSVRPMPKPPMARESNAFLFVGFEVFTVKCSNSPRNGKAKVVVALGIPYRDIGQNHRNFNPQGQGDPWKEPAPERPKGLP